MMRELLVKLGRYFVTAGVAAIVDIGGFVLLVGAGLALVPAATASFCVAAVVNYLASSRFVFGARPSIRGFARFFAGALAGLAINVGVTFLAATQLGLVPALAKTVGVGVAFLANFAINATLVFRQEPRREPTRTVSEQDLQEQSSSPRRWKRLAGVRESDIR